MDISCQHFGHNERLCCIQCPQIIPLCWSQLYWDFGNCFWIFYSQPLFKHFTHIYTTEIIISASSPFQAVELVQHTLFYVLLYHNTCTPAREILSLYVCSDVRQWVVHKLRRSYRVLTCLQLILLFLLLLCFLIVVAFVPLVVDNYCCFCCFCCQHSL